METIAISRFKATCLAVMEQVKRTRTPVVVTRRGEPVVEVVPPPPEPKTKSWLGAWVGKGRITGDIVAPASEERDWEALRD